MKKIFLPAFVILLFGFELNAQTTSQSLTQEFAQESATIICNCINNTFSSFEEMADETGEKWAEVETCMGASEEALDLKYSDLENDPNFSDEIFNQLMLETLGQMEGCDLAYTVMQLGMSESTNTEDSGEHKK
jgi:hypothetical protein